MRALALPLVVVVVTVVLGMSGCPTGSLVGQPCDDAGEKKCEETSLIRCDGDVWVELTGCSHECIGEMAEVKHEDATIDANETWSCAEGPHLVNPPQQTLTITAGNTLNIGEGALIRLGPAARIVTDIDGRIESKGSSAAPILVTPQSGEVSGFGGGAEGGLNVFATTGGDPSVIQYTIIERGTHGLGVFKLAQGSTPPIVKNNTLRDNTGYGIFISCDGDDAPIPDFEADGNEFFKNGDGEVSSCTP